MPRPPNRYKEPADRTVEEIYADLEAASRGVDAPQPETAEYRKYKSDALRAAGLDDEADAAEPDAVVSIEDLTAEEHYRRMTPPR